MSDRTSAGIFANVFEFLAEQPDDRAKSFALRMWNLRGDYDFSDQQMGCDPALVKLGLAVECSKCGTIDYFSADTHSEKDCAADAAARARRG